VAAEASRALRDLACALAIRGLYVRCDPGERAVDAATVGPGTRALDRRVAVRVLQRDSADGGWWWWLMIPGHETGDPRPRPHPDVFPLAAPYDVDGAARRVYRTLVLNRDAAP
jgi:hypothetical protein